LSRRRLVADVCHEHAHHGPLNTARRVRT
jgi:hypothetical protein